MNFEGSAVVVGVVVAVVEMMIVVVAVVDYAVDLRLWWL